MPLTSIKTGSIWTDVMSVLKRPRNAHLLDLVTTTVGVTIMVDVVAVATIITADLGLDLVIEGMAAIPEDLDLVTGIVAVGPEIAVITDDRSLAMVSNF